MRRALPAIAVSAAGLTWLLHVQGVIDTTTVSSGSANPGGAATTTPADRPAPPTTAAGPPVPPTTSRNRPGVRPGSPSTSVPSTTAPATAGGTPTDGPVIDTRFGPVQVEAVVSGNRLTDVTFLQYPDDARRSQQINLRAMPTLVQESLTAQSAEVDTVSGATYTSEAYTESLQAALDQAGFKR